MKRKRLRQLQLSSEFDSEKEFGGALLKKSHAKKARPIAIKKTMHLTLRSSKARGEMSFLNNKERRQKIEKVVRTQAHKFGVELFRFANVGNHLHLLVKASHREGFKCFLRAIAGIIARIATGAQRGQALQIKKRSKRATELQKNKIASERFKVTRTESFWDQRPWTRVLFTWTEFKNVKRYVEQNFNEAMGFIPYKPRKVKSTA